MNTPYPRDIFPMMSNTGGNTAKDMDQPDRLNALTVNW